MSSCNVSRPRRLRKRFLRRGAIVLLTAIFLMIAFVLLAFAVDIGFMVTTQAELQNAADAGALAGARRLMEGSQPARTAASTAAAANKSAGQAIAIVADEDIELGMWDENNATFTKLAAAVENQANAIRVTCRRNALRKNSLKLFFGGVAGTSTSILSS